MTPYITFIITFHITRIVTSSPALLLKGDLKEKGANLACLPAKAGVR
jgi:hypothetical protein